MGEILDLWNFYNGRLISSSQDLECKFKNTFGTGMCEFGLGGAFYRRSLTLVCVVMFRCDRQDLCNDVFNGVARKMQRLHAIAAALCNNPVFKKSVRLFVDRKNHLTMI